MQHTLLDWMQRHDAGSVPALSIPDISNTCLYLLNSSERPLVTPWTGAFFWAEFDKDRVSCRVWCGDQVLKQRRCLFQLKHRSWQARNKYRFTGAYAWFRSTLIFLHVVTFRDSFVATLHLCDVVTGNMQYFVGTWPIDVPMVTQQSSDVIGKYDSCILGTQLFVRPFEEATIVAANIYALFTQGDYLFVLHIMPCNDGARRWLRCEHVCRIPKMEVESITNAFVTSRGDVDVTSEGFFVNLKDIGAEGRSRRIWDTVLHIEPHNKRWSLRPIACPPLALQGNSEDEEHLWYSCSGGSMVYTQLLEPYNVPRRSTLLSLDTTHPELRWTVESCKLPTDIDQLVWFYRSQGSWYVQTVDLTTQLCGGDMVQYMRRESTVYRAMGSNTAPSLLQLSWEALMSKFPAASTLTFEALLRLGIPKYLAAYLKNHTQHLRVGCRIAHHRPHSTLRRNF